MSLKPKQLLAQDVMLTRKQFPVVKQDELMKETLDTMNHFRIGIACIVDNEDKLVAVITDGDLRRTLLSCQKPLSALLVDDVLDHASIQFKSVLSETSIIDIVNVMGRHKIQGLPVIDNSGLLIGLVHLHPAISALIDLNNI